MDPLEILEKSPEKARSSLSLIIKVILVATLFYATYFRIWHILVANTLLLILTFLPYLLKRKYEVHIPKEFEFILLLFIITTFFLGPIRGFIIQLFFGLAIGFAGFTIMLILFANSKMKTSYFLIIIFTLSFSVALGLGVEMAKYYLKLILELPFGQDELAYTMRSLSLVAIGSLASSIIGYTYMKGKRNTTLNRLVQRFKKENPNLFIEKTDSPEEIINLIQKGENEKIEFKETLRINIHTNQHDKKMEDTTLKTLTAFLNSEGGTLLIGISDNGEIKGIEKDGFENTDRFILHLTNLIKERIGRQYIPYLTIELVLIEGKNIIKIQSKKSNQPVFLKDGKEEHFFIRIGPSTNELLGSKLVDYIKNNFGK